VPGESGEDFGDLRCGFSLPENHLGHARAQAAMVIYLGEIEIFKGKMAQALHGIIGGKFALAHLLEQFADGFGVHGKRRHSAAD